MRVDDLFTVRYGHSLELNRLTVDDSPHAINFVSRTSKNNGVSARVAPVAGVTPAPAGTLSVALGGSVLETFLQPSPYLCGFHVAVLEPKSEMTEPELLWWAGCIRANRFRYNYGRQANRTLASLELPDGVPDWVMQQAAPQLPTPTRRVSPVITEEWAPYRLDRLFTFEKGRVSGLRKYGPGRTPFIGASAQGNGVTCHLDIDAHHPAGAITVAKDGSVGEAFYQPRAFAATVNVHVLYPTGWEMDSRRALFICTLIELEKFRYNYGRKWRLELVKSCEIKLPITASGAVDWEWIDTFMSELPYSAEVSLVL